LRGVNRTTARKTPEPHARLHKTESAALPDLAVRGRFSCTFILSRPTSTCEQGKQASKPNKKQGNSKGKGKRDKGKGERGKGKGESIAQTRARSCVWAPNARFWKSGATMAEVQRGRVRCGRDTKWGLLPEAVVGLPGRAYCFTRGRQKVGDDQLNTVSRGGGKPMLEPGKKKPSKHESISTAAKQNCPKSQIPKFRIWARKCFPPHPIPKQSFPNFGIWVCLS
jgi:hypothetical protein